MNDRSNARLDFQQTYPCPICRRGKISGLALMDAFGCPSCNHIFSVGSEQQSLQLADSSPQLSWRWDGRRWRSLGGGEAQLSWEVWLVAAAFVGLPPTLVGVTAYLFPPLPGSSFNWFPLAWTALTFLVHFGIVAWLILEYYQFPWLLYWQAQQQQWRSQMARFWRFDRARS